MSDVHLTADEAIAKQRARYAALDVDELYASVLERLAVRNPPGDWQVMRCPSAVRLFLNLGTEFMSRYVWDWQDTDALIDLLAKRRS